MKDLKSKDINLIWVFDLKISFFDFSVLSVFSVAKE